MECRMTKIHSAYPDKNEWWRGGYFLDDPCIRTCTCFVMGFIGTMPSCVCHNP